MRPLALVVGVISVLASLYLVDNLSAEWLAFAAYLFSPWALLTFGAHELRTPARGIALLVVTAMAATMYVSIFTGDAADGVQIGWIWLPAAQWLTVGVVVVLQRVVRRNQNA